MPAVKSWPRICAKVDGRTILKPTVLADQRFRTHLRLNIVDGVEIGRYGHRSADVGIKHGKTVFEVKVVPRVA